MRNWKSNVACLGPRSAACTAVLVLVTACLAQQADESGEHGSAPLQRLIAAGDKQQQAALLDEQPELVSDKTLLSLLSQQQLLTNTGRQASALRAGDAALMIAERLDSDRLRGITWLMRAGTLRKMDRPEQGLEAAREAVRFLEADANPGLLAMAWDEMAEQHELRGELRKALEDQQNALRIIERLPEELRTKPRAGAYAAIADLSRKLGDIDQARQYAQQAIELAEQVDAKATKASALNCLGSIQLDQGSLEQARQTFEAMLELHRQANNRAGTMSALNSLAIAHKRLGQYEESSAYYQEALAMAVALKQRSLQGTFLDNIGSLLRLTGEWEEGVRRHEQALEIMTEIENPAGEAMVRSHLGLVYRDQGDYSGAEQHFKRALLIYRAMQQPGRIAMVLNNLANLYRMREQHVEAIAAYREALEIFERLGYREGVIAGYLNLSHTYSRLRAIPTVRFCLEQAIEWAERGEDRQSQAVAWEIKAQLLDLEPTPESADEAYACRERALELYGDQASKQVTMLLADMAMHAAWKDEPDEQRAKQLFTRMLAAAQNHKVREDQVIALTGLGMVELDATPQRPQSAKAYFQQAADVADLGFETQLLGLAQYFLGKACAAMGDSDGMLHNYLASIDTREKVRASLHSPELHLNFRDDGQRVYGYVVEHLIRRGDVDRAFEYAERGKARFLQKQLEEQEIRMQADLPRELRERQGRLHARLAASGMALQRAKDRDHPGDETVSRLEREIRSIKDDIDRLIVEMRAASPGYAAVHHPLPCSLGEAQALLDERTALLEYVISDRNGAVLVVRRDQVDGKLLDASQDEIDAAAARFWQLAGKPIANNASASRLVEAARTLHEMLLEPILPLVEDADHLIVVPDGKLHYVPFEALVQEKAASAGALRYLLEDFAVSYGPSATVLAEFASRSQKFDSAPANVLAVGDPLFPAERAAAGQLDLSAPLSEEIARLDRLPGTAREVQEIQQLLGDGVVALTREAATEENFRRHVADARIIHLGTHGVVDDQRSLFSSLVFSVPIEQVDSTDGSALSRDVTIPAGTPEDGFLQTFEVFDLDLNADLVVLSACSSGLGELHGGEGLMSLARAFSVGGAKSQVLTLWNVNDASSAALITEFYRGFVRDGMSKAQALRQAKLAMIHDYDPQEEALRGTVRQRKKAAPARRLDGSADRTLLPPHFWAGYVLNGDWR